ncbi:hypothetical protein FOCC_FOCC003604 [Frankliniella occidentalis]|nr:hypothetical protein FOCC_FOCC003604 [Frankliniella occidentalis]
MQAILHTEVQLRRLQLVKGPERLLGPRLYGRRAAHALPVGEGMKQRVYILRNATLSVEKFAILFRAISPTALREALWSSKLEVWDEKDKLLVCAIIKVKYLERKQ